MNVDGQVAVVTGGASGLGAATAAALLAAGAKVVIIDLDSAGARERVERLGPGARFAPADVRDEDAVSAALDLAEQAGDLRVLVNCAGIGDPARTIGREGPVDMARFRRVVDVNLFGTFNVLRLAAARMAKTTELDGERGVIVNTASAAAFDGQIGQASYSASKGAIAAMTLPIARDLSRSLIRVVTIAPGIFDTPILQALSEDARASIAAQVPHPARLGRPEEYAAMVLHMVANAMVNGETIRLDGAIRMAPS